MNRSKHGDWLFPSSSRPPRQDDTVKLTSEIRILEELEAEHLQRCSKVLLSRLNVSGGDEHCASEAGSSSPSKKRGSTETRFQSSRPNDADSAKTRSGRK